MSLRARLVIGYAFLFCLALLLLGGGAYHILRGALVSEVDKALQDRALQLERAPLSRGQDNLNTPQLTADIFVLTPATAGEELEAPGIMARVFDGAGRTLAASSGIAAQLKPD